MSRKAEASVYCPLCEAKSRPADRERGLLHDYNGLANDPLIVLNLSGSIAMPFRQEKSQKSGVVNTTGADYDV